MQRKTVISKNRIKVYLDHNSTTPPRQEVFQGMAPYLKDFYGNPSSQHAMGKEAKRIIEASRKTIALFLNTESVDIIFTSGGTEANNLAIKGVAYANKDKACHIITTAVEHISVLNTCKALETQGFEVTYVGVDRFGIVDVDVLKKAVRKDTVLISVMYANNEVGTIQPIKDIARFARERGVYFHTDAVQAFGKLPLDVDDLGVDLLSISSHKIYGPKGAGALYIRKGVEIAPIQHGGLHERGLRPGTENVPGIAGFGKAASFLQDDMKTSNTRINELSNIFLDGLKDKIDNISLNGHPTKRIPGTINLLFDGLDAESLVSHLDDAGICASTGSACAEGLKEPSYVLLAMGLTPEQARSSVRFSLGITNTKKQINYCLDVISEIVKRLRR